MFNRLWHYYFYHKELLIWVNPSKIDDYIHSNKPLTHESRIKITKSKKSRMTKLIQRFLLEKHDLFFLPNNAFKSRIRIEDYSLYQLLLNFSFYLDNINESQWYNWLKYEIQSKESFKYKHTTLKSEQDIVIFLNGIKTNLFESIQNKGYVFNPKDDIGSCLIDENGNILKSLYGRHRFFISRIFGISKIPLRIHGINQKFYEENTTNQSKRKNLIQIRKIIEEKYN